MDKTLSVAEKKFGSFSGVFLPTILAILGAVLYLRMGWFVEVAGVKTMIAIISIATLVTLITSFSISAAATNTEMGSGGVYYLLSRTFGIEAGSAIAIPLMFAQAMWIAFCVTAFSESIAAIWPTVNQIPLSLMTLTALTALAWVSTSLVIKAQMMILCAIVLSLASFFLGSTPTHSTLTSSAAPLPFWTLFALFFPAVTGIEVGATLSKELNRPSLSLPLGTVGAVLVGYCVYIAITLFYGKLGIIGSHPLLMADVARFKLLVIGGIWGATLSGALSNLLSTPRLLEALAQENILPKWVQGRFALLATTLLASAAILLGSMDAIAPILSMFFLIAYGMINFSAAIQGIIDNPSWRPTFKTPWSLSLGGGILCASVMLMINPGATLIALMLVTLLYLGMKKRNMTVGWEDMRHSILLLLSRHAIYELSRVPVTAKNWRPNFLVFIGDPLQRSHLSALAGAITHKKGFLTFASIVPDHVEITRAHLKEHLRIPSLIEVRQNQEMLSGMCEMVATYGLGPLFPNTIVLGVTHKPEKFDLFAEVIKTSYSSKRNIILVRENGFQRRLEIKKQLGRGKQIDVWWGGQSKRNSELMLILAHMLQTSDEWHGATLTLKTVVNNTDDYEPMQQMLEQFAKKGRLSLNTKIVSKKEDEDLFSQTILNSSREADLVLLGLRPPTDDYSAYYAQLLAKTAGFPTLVFVLAGESIDFESILT